MDVRACSMCEELNAMCSQDDDFWDSMSPGVTASPSAALEIAHAPKDGVLVVVVLLSFVLSRV